MTARSIADFAGRSLNEIPSAITVQRRTVNGNSEWMIVSMDGVNVLTQPSDQEELYEKFANECLNCHHDRAQHKLEVFNWSLGKTITLYLCGVVLSIETDSKGRQVDKACSCWTLKERTPIEIAEKIEEVLAMRELYHG